MFCNTNHLHFIHNNKTSTTKFYSKGLQLSNKQQHFHLLYLNFKGSSQYSSHPRL